MGRTVGVVETNGGLRFACFHEMQCLTESRIGVIFARAECLGHECFDVVFAYRFSSCLQKYEYKRHVNCTRFLM